MKKTPFPKNLVVHNGCKHMKIMYLSAAVEETNLESILAVMNTTELVLEIRPEENSGKYGI